MAQRLGCQSVTKQVLAYHGQGLDPHLQQHTKKESDSRRLSPTLRQTSVEARGKYHSSDNCTHAATETDALPPPKAPLVIPMARSTVVWHE